MKRAAQRDASAQTPELKEAMLSDQTAPCKKAREEPGAAGSSIKGNNGEEHAASQVLKQISPTL